MATPAQAATEKAKVLERRIVILLEVDGGSASLSTWTQISALLASRSSAFMAPKKAEEILSISMVFGAAAARQLGAKGVNEDIMEPAAARDAIDVRAALSENRLTPVTVEPAFAEFRSS